MNKKEVNAPNAPKAIGPYSQAILSSGGSFLYCSGQVALPSEGSSLVSNDVAEQTKQVMSNLEQVLKAGGCSFDQVVKTTIFLKDLGDFDVVNKIYAEYFQPPYPARATIEVSRLPKDAKVEIEVVAMAPAHT